MSPRVDSDSGVNSSPDTRPDIPGGIHRSQEELSKPLRLAPCRSTCGARETYTSNRIVTQNSSRAISFAAFNPPRWSLPLFGNAKV